MNVCHLPGPVFKAAVQVPSAAFVVPPTVVPDTEPPQAIGVAARHSGPPLGPLQEEHVTVVVRQPDARVLQALLRLMCRKSGPIAVAVTVSGVVPQPKAVPPDVP